MSKEIANVQASIFQTNFIQTLVASTQSLEWVDAANMILQDQSYKSDI